MYNLYRLKEKCVDPLGNTLAVSAGLLLGITITLLLLGKM